MRSKTVQLLGALALVQMAGNPPAIAQIIERASVAPAGRDSNGDSMRPELSPDDRFLVFDSTASNLIPDDHNGQRDIFLLERRFMQLRRVNLLPGGGEMGGCSDPKVSKGGRWVVFVNRSDEVTAGDRNGVADVYLLKTGARGTRVLERIQPRGPEPNGASDQPGMCHRGQVLTFRSEASNLVGDDHNGASDVFRFERKSQRLQRVSRGTGAEANGASFDPAISGSGRWVAFTSEASNIAGGDTNQASDVFLFDGKREHVHLVSRRPDGRPGNGASGRATVDTAGRFIAFESDASDLVPFDFNGTRDVFLFDRRTEVVTRVSLGPHGIEPRGGDCFDPRLSGSGRFVVFSSSAPNVGTGGPGGIVMVYRRNLQTGEVTPVSLNSQRAPRLNDNAEAPVLDRRGQTAAFQSLASNVVGGDNNGSMDVFVVRDFPIR